ncbi:ankyrin repeat domain-containing protein [Desulfovibrio subterraneus]|nr:hypothetical protein [Desulfovibrio subterraneus]
MIVSPLRNIALLFAILILCACSGGPGEDGQNKPLYRMSVEEMFPNQPLEQQLLKAAVAGDLKKVDALIENGANINARGAYGVTLPVWLTLHPNIEGFKHLLMRGADPNIPWDKDKSLIAWCTLFAPELGIEYLKAILEIGNGNPNMVHPEDGSRPLDYASARDNVEAFVLLYNAGAEIDFYDKYGNPYVDDLISAHNFEVARFVLGSGVDFKKEGPLGSMVKFVTEIKANELSQYFKGEERKWFWSCVRYMEENGMEFNFSQEADRPAIISDDLPDIFNKSYKKVVYSKVMYMHGAKVTCPTPLWTQRAEDFDDFIVNNKEEPGRIVVKYVPRRGGDGYSMIISSCYSKDEAGGVDGVLLDSVMGQYGEGVPLQLEWSSEGKRLFSFYGSGEKPIDGYVFIGSVGNTFVCISQSFPSNGADTEKSREIILEQMKNIKIENGFRVFGEDDLVH